MLNHRSSVHRMGVLVTGGMGERTGKTNVELETDLDVRQLFLSVLVVVKKVTRPVQQAGLGKYLETEADKS